MAVSLMLLVAGIALGSIIGAAMVAIALAFGITAMLAPMRFEQVEVRTFCLPLCLLTVIGRGQASCRSMTVL